MELVESSTVTVNMVLSTVRLFDAMRFRAHAYDQAVSALIEDIYERGLDKRVLVVVTGEFGRTPKIEYATKISKNFKISRPASCNIPLVGVSWMEAAAVCRFFKARLPFESRANAN